MNETTLVDSYREIIEDLNDIIEDIDDGVTEDVAAILDRLKSIHPDWNN